MRNIVIIGGGAAGLMAAVTAAKKDKTAAVTVIEKNERPARKVMITGKGRCNVTNNSDINEFLANIPRNPRFLYSAYSSFSSADTMDFFENCGVPLKTERGSRVFPVSDKAVDIVDALVKSANAARVRFICGTAESITAENGVVSGVVLTDKSYVSADSVLVATGGLSYPVTGSTGDGYKLAAALGHTVTECLPSLVPVCCREGLCSHLSGLSLKNVTLSLFENGRKNPVYSELGEMLFTHFGISGPLVLTASAYLNQKKEYYCEIDLKPGLNDEKLDARLLRDFEEYKNKDILNSLDKLLPKSIIPYIIDMAGIEKHQKINQLSREQRRSLIGAIKRFKLNLSGTRPVEEAIITRGGIKVGEIDPKTMQSKKVPGLFFAGEVIDVDAFTGGFNLQIAFSTGHLAGENM